MKKIIILVLAVCFTLGFAGCTLNYPVSDEPETQADVAEDVTEKEELVPLLAADEENELYLYGIKPDGVILYADGAGHYYDWSYSCDDYKAPQIFTGFFDNDSTEDIAVVTYTKNDGVSVEDIRIISDGDFEADDVYLVNEDEFNSYVAYHVEKSFANNAVTFSLDGVNYSFDLSESFSKLVYDGVSYSENVSYELTDGKIYVNIIPVVSSADEENDYGKVNVDITVRAKLNFDGYNISLSEAELIPHLQ